jgi:dynein heavy chain, axonemal
MRMYVNELSLRLCDLSNLALSDLSFLDRRTVESLIIGDVHNRDIGEQMMYKNVSEISDFDWKSSLRSYWESNNI